MEKYKNIENRADYKISDQGNVKSFAKHREGKVLKPRVHKLGYKIIKIGKESLYVHRLVAKAFLSPVEGRNEVNHINGDKADNRLSNLEWSNRSHNIRHALDTGLIPARLSLNKVAYIKSVTGLFSNRTIAKQMGVSAKTINDVNSGRIWNRD
jgi:hypothetical protein